jgi:hypothetical protein
MEAAEPSPRQKKPSTRVTAELTGWLRFGVGFAGGLSPYALGFAAFCLSAPPPEALPSLFTAVVSTTGVLVFSAMGGFLSAIWDRKEKDLKRLFFVGMAAPSIIISTLNNIGQGVEKAKSIRKANQTEEILSQRSVAFKIS